MINQIASSTSISNTTSFTNELGKIARRPSPHTTFDFNHRKLIIGKIKDKIIDQFLIDKKIKSDEQFAEFREMIRNLSNPDEVIYLTQKINPKITQLISNLLKEGKWELLKAIMLHSTKEGYDISKSEEFKQLSGDEKQLIQDKLRLKNKKMAFALLSTLIRDPQCDRLDVATGLNLLSLIQENGEAVTVHRLFSENGKENMETMKAIEMSLKLERREISDDKFLEFKSKLNKNAVVFSIDADERNYLNQEIYNSIIGAILEIGMNTFTFYESENRIKRMVPGLGVFQAYLDSTTPYPVKLNPVMGLSDPLDIANNGIEGKRDVWVPFPYILPLTEGDGRKLYGCADMGQHDLGHGEESSLISPENRKKFVLFSLELKEKLSKEIQKLSLNKKEKEQLESGIQDLFERFIDLDFLTYESFLNDEDKYQNLLPQLTMMHVAEEFFLSALASNKPLQVQCRKIIFDVFEKHFSSLPSIREFQELKGKIEKIFAKESQRILQYLVENLQDLTYRIDTRSAFNNSKVEKQYGRQEDSIEHFYYQNMAPMLTQRGLTLEKLNVVRDTLKNLEKSNSDLVEILKVFHSEDSYLVLNEDECNFILEKNEKRSTRSIDNLKEKDIVEAILYKLRKISDVLSSDPNSLPKVEDKKLMGELRKEICSSLPFQMRFAQNLNVDERIKLFRWMTNIGFLHTFMRRNEALKNWEF